MIGRKSITKKSEIKIPEEKQIKKISKKFIMQKWDEIAKWKLVNANQRWFFSLEEKEQDFIETMFIIVVQMCPELTWEVFIDRMRKADRVKAWGKAVVKKVIWEW